MGGGGEEEVMVLFTYFSSIPPSLLPIKRGSERSLKDILKTTFYIPFSFCRVGLRRGDLLKGSSP